MSRLARFAPLALLASGTSGCKAAAAEKPTAVQSTLPTAVRLAPVARGDISRPVRGTGLVRLKSEVDLSFKVGGVVSAVLVDEGALVKKGQLLARVDPTEVGAALRQAEEGLAKAERDFARIERLHASGAVPVAQRDDAETGLRLARAARDAASFNAQRSSILAPDDGRIDRRVVEPGEVVAPGRPVFHLSGRSRGAVVRLALTDRDVLRVAEGDLARVMVDARPGEVRKGKVSQIATLAAPGAGTFDVEVKLDEGGSISLSGLTAKVEIAHVERDLFNVPTSSLVDGRGDRASVFVVEEGKARKVPVRVAFLFGKSAALAPPFDALLASAPAVVEAGASGLDDGANVRVLP